MRWMVYKVPMTGKRLRYLGTVKAEHQPAALKLAWEKWPGAVNWKQVQGGFTLKLV